MRVQFHSQVSRPSISRFAGLLAFGLLYASGVMGQSAHKIDSLVALIKIQKADTIQLRLYSALCDVCDIKDNLKYAEPLVKLADSLLSVNNYKSARKSILEQKANAFSCIVEYYQKYEGGGTPKALIYHEKMLLIYKEINDSKDFAKTIYDIGFDYARQGNVMKQLEYYQQNIELLSKMNYKKGMQLLLSQVASIYMDYGDTTQAVEKMQMSLSVANELKDTSLIGNNLINIGILYSRIHDTANALDYFKKAIILFEKKNNEKGVGIAYFYIGQLYFQQKNFAKALEYFQKYLPIVKGHNNYMTSRALRAICQVYENQANYNEAIRYCNDALNSIKNGDYDIETSRGLSQLGLIYWDKKQYKTAKEYMQQSLSLAIKSGELASIMLDEKSCAQLDSILGDYKSAYAHYQQYVIYSEKLNKDGIHKALAKENLRNDYEKKKAIDKAEQEKKEVIVQEEKQRQKTITYFTIAGLMLVLLFATFISKAYVQKRKANFLLEDKNKIIEEKNKDITSSITYAKRIQHARLPKRNEITSALPQSFILFKPKDIVSGDFYFFHTNGNSVLIAAADCTGHGVPGAFMSIIGSEKLSLAVEQSTDTSHILNYLNKELKNSLHQSEDKESTRDGMDIAICSIDMKSHIVRYAGANRPFWLIRKGKSEIEEIKATKKAIGGFTEDDQHFDSHEIELEQGDTFYIFSDGYADTFGGPNQKKLTTKNFKQLLIAIQDKTMPQQEQCLDDHIEKWKAGVEQVDDILVIGVRI